MAIKNYTSTVDVFTSLGKYRARSPGTARVRSWWNTTKGTPDGRDLLH